jgi:hypothetical protein
MKNLAYQDAAGGTIHVFSAHKELKKEERIKIALQELNRTAKIKIFLVDGKKIKYLFTKGYNQFSEGTQKYYNN